MRELVQMFSDSESRDELGIGQIRDVFSNRLFPGTSVIQTRSRYFLFIPWLFKQHQAKGRVGDDLLRRVRESERTLIATMLAADQREGLIGRDAGTRVKTLPSAIYWSGLQSLGVLQVPVAPNEIGPAVSSSMHDPEAGDERSGRAPSVWHPTIPEPPADFPNQVLGGFDLTRDEGIWMRELILEAAPRTLLAHLVSASTPPEESWAPWADPVAMSAREELQLLIADAERFSTVMHGASLLYNLLLAEAYERAGLTAVEGSVDEYVAQLEAWAEEIDPLADQLRSWDLPSWWAEVRAYNPRITPLTQRFVDTWVAMLATGDASSIATNPAARALIADRERTTKKAQARLVNHRLLRAWNGASGTRRLVYRWGTVRRLVADIVNAAEGLDAGPR